MKDLKDCKTLNDIARQEFGKANYTNREKCKKLLEENGINTWRSEAISLRMLDDLFRGEDEIPKGYIFDNGEYEGWLQYRWGDGKNAVNCNEPSCKPKKKRYGKHEQFDEDDADELDNEIQAELIQDEYNVKLEKETIAQKLERW